MRYLGSRLGNERGYWGLVALLVVVAIGFALYALVISPKMGSREQRTRQEAGKMGVKLNEQKSLPGAAIDAGKQTACQAELNQIRQGIVMYRNDNDRNPSSLSDLRLGMGAQHFRCPAGGEPYVYDPNTGTVRCVHPGHERL